MKNNILLLLLFVSTICSAQIICISCFDSTLTPLNPGSTNLILNGSFETNTITTGQYFCPNSSFYNGPLGNWVCTGGGTSTYAQLIDSNSLSQVSTGQYAAYLGNSFTTQICNDLTLDCLVDSACVIKGLDTLLYPTVNSPFGNSDGVSVEQTVAGLVPGNNYILEFWAGGEDIFPSVFPERGIFGVDIGFGKLVLECYPTAAGNPSDLGTRYAILFRALSSSHTFKFTNWGHICPRCSELVLDDVRLYDQASAINKLGCTTYIYKTKNIDTLICEGDSVFFHNQYISDSGVYSFDTIIADTNLTTSIHVQFRDCTIKDPIIKVPNAFSPNGDNNNDVFIVYGKNIDEYHIKIFNRWGEMVYQSDNVSELNVSGWDGRYKGNYCDIGIYTYYIDSRNNLTNQSKIYKGNISLIK